MTLTADPQPDGLRRHPRSPREAAGSCELRPRELVEAGGREQAPARREHDVPDPYRRGRAANAEAAAQIDGLLAIVAPR